MLARGELFAGRYRVVSLLGRGGMGAVYRVTDVASGRELALKVLVQVEDAARLRFRHEFHTMKRLAHPGVVEVYEFGVEGDELYYTMELLGDEPLSRCGWEQACTILAEISAALAFLHGRGLVHRDISPGNVRLDRQGRAKIIDFGIIVAAGVISEPAGTPPLIAPETLRSGRVDARTDLYALGALAYWLLAGHHAYPAAGLLDLHTAWRLAPLPVDHVPEGMAALVTELLSHDAMERPRSATEVFERLRGLGAAVPERSGSDVERYLDSSELVGRTPELEHFRARLGDTAAGKGAALLLTGPAGIGRTRLLSELAVEAQLDGAVVVRARARDGVPYGLVRDLGRRLLEQYPGAHRHAAPHLEVIGAVVPELGWEPPARSLEESDSDLAGPERRLRIQTAMATWLLEVTAETPLVLLIDDFEEADEASAALVAALAHQTKEMRLLLVAALRSDRPARAPLVLQGLRAGATTVELQPLGHEEVEALLVSSFGAFTAMAELTRWMLATTGGVPLLCVEVARHLVASGKLNFMAGTWSLSPGFAIDAPATVERALDGLVAQLPAGPRALAESLSVHAGPTSLELCARLAGGSDDGLFEHLAALEHHGVLTRGTDGYQFRHQGVRDACQRGLSAEASCRLHGVAGRFYVERGLSAETEEVAGWHLLRGGHEESGAEILYRVGVRHWESLSHVDAVAPLEAALEVYQRRGAPAAVLIELRKRLFFASAGAGRQVSLCYLDAAVADFSRFSGLRVARVFAPVVGGKLAVLIGLLWAGMCWLFSLPSHRGPTPVQALQDFLRVAGHSAASCLAAYDLRRMDELISLTRPLAAFRGQILSCSPNSMVMNTNFLLGNREEAIRLIGVVERTLLTDKKSPITVQERDLSIALNRLLAAMTLCPEEFPEDDLRVIEEFGPALEVGVLQVRCGYHRWRGEEGLAQECENRAQLRFIQLGRFWQMEVWRAASIGSAYAATGDLMGLKLNYERLQELIRQGYELSSFRDLMEAEYRSECGEVEQARDLCRHVLATTERRELPLRVWARTALASCMLKLGAYGEALSLATDPENDKVGRWRWRLAGLAALAEAHLGDRAAARQRVAATLEIIAPQASPVACGSLAEVLARIALLERDHLLFVMHLEETRRWYRLSDNPVLVARAGRLASALSSSVQSAASDSGDHAVRRGFDALGVDGSPLACTVEDDAEPEEQPTTAVLSSLHS